MQTSPACSGSHTFKTRTKTPGWVLLSLGSVVLAPQSGTVCIYLTEHANDEALGDGFDIYDVECGILNGKMRRVWPREGKYEVIGSALDRRSIGVVCRITQGNKVRVITVYEDRPKH